MKKKIKDLTPTEIIIFCINHKLGCERCPFHNVTCGTRENYLQGKEQEVEIDESNND